MHLTVPLTARVVRETRLGHDDLPAEHESRSEQNACRGLQGLSLCGHGERVLTRTVLTRSVRGGTITLRGLLLGAASAIAHLLPVIPVRDRSLLRPNTSEPL